MNKYDILAWFFPNKCLICGEYSKANEFVCKDCLQIIEPIERRYNIKMGKKSVFMKVHAVYSYEENYEKFLKRFKFGGKTAYSRKFAGLIYGTFIDFPFDKYDYICYVPMNKTHEKARGYNQAKLLAKNLSKLSGVSLSDALIKHKYNNSQRTLKAKERIENVRGVYKCTDEVKGKNIILVDDIVTTGATICQCAKMLYMAGANSVTAFCAANTEAPL